MKGRVEVTLFGRAVPDWLGKRGSDFQSHRQPCWGALALMSADLDPWGTNGGNLHLAVLGDGVEPANTLELAQVVIEQIAALPDADLLAHASLELRILAV